MCKYSSAKPRKYTMVYNDELYIYIQVDRCKLLPALQEFLAGSASMVIRILPSRWYYSRLSALPVGKEPLLRDLRRSMFILHSLGLMSSYELNAPMSGQFRERRPI